MRILVIDDSPDQQRLICTMLAAAGYADVVAMESAREALRHLTLLNQADTAARIDLVLLDIMMPVMDGLEACRRIKAMEPMQDVPVIVITAKTDAASLQAAFEAGAMDFIRKPFTKVELLARIKSALALTREMAERKEHERQLLVATRHLEAANRILLRQSSLDGLTGIPNRRRFDEFLDQEWRKAVRAGTPLSLLMIDVDQFKLYNDTYGHQGGDECLKRVAGALCRTVKRPGDLVARYGGEEFAVVLPNTSMEGAGLVAEAVRGEVEAAAVPHARAQAAGHVTISVGVATIVPERETSPGTLVSAADQALYRAKGAGRNRVAHADSTARPQTKELP